MNSYIPDASAAEHRLARPNRLVPAVVDDLIERIHLDEYPPGAVIPNENALAAQYGVSRPVVREALRSMGEKGMVAIQQGRGTEVRPRDEWDLFDPEVLAAQVRHDRSRTVVTNLVQVRAAVESELARSAATRLTEEDRHDLEAIFAELASSLDDPVAYLSLDKQFHDRIMRAANNPFGRIIVRKVASWTRALPRESGLDPREIPLSHQGHTRVFESVLAKDPVASSDAMRSHILDAWNLRLETKPGLGIAH